MIEDGSERRLATSLGKGWKLPWETRPEEPNGGENENCAAMKKGLVLYS